ncbi:unnamed protein product [Kuraishia capsulata CBS 1993]|uniref:Bud site selection protein RAX2 n=1 Tax=Kuraishia capsulata CBS 1993 TaxID=1382522 RepID=W6MMG7_9ASCO|nr:uncharacterized protein KUCA_T00003763001 [Kuraishia capsulata CBS 1993]CDK27784.1 unnamed protein product [Kuraishia capsulata CBS 1993]
MASLFRLMVSALLAFANLANCLEGYHTTLIDQPDIDYDQVGNQLYFLGNFDALSEYKHTGQFNTSVISNTSSNNSIYLLSDTLHNVGSLPFENGTVSIAERVRHGYYVIVIDGAPYFFNLSGFSINEVSGWSHSVTGDVRSVLVDTDEEIIYFGGNLTYDKDLYGVIAYDYSSDDFHDLPFSGFNKGASVNSIVKVPGNGEDELGSIVFGGSFDALGNTDLMNFNVSSNQTYNITNSTYTSIDPNRLVSLKYATISSVNTDSSSDASSILCPGSDTEWLLEPETYGSWTASLEVSLIPSKIRLYNSKDDSSSVSIFRVITSPANGIMNMTYLDPYTGDFAYCDAWCPLISNSDLKALVANNSDAIKGVVSEMSENDQGFLRFSDEYQEFEFYNEISVESITIEVIAYDGSQGGLSGFQMFQYGLYAYANDTLNEPTCSGSKGFSASEETGDLDWKHTSAGDSSYMSATFNPKNVKSGSGVSFFPSIEYSGNYSVLLYTPGCSADNSCDHRGIVNATFYEGDDTMLGSSLVYQTNMYEKYDQIYQGHVDVKKGSPYLTMTFENGFSDSKVVMVADKVYVDILGIDAYKNRTMENETTTDYDIPIRNLFEYSLSNFSDYTESFENNVFVGNSSLNLIGSQVLNEDATVNALLYTNDSLIIAGDFDSDYGADAIQLTLNSYNASSNSTSIKTESSLSAGLTGTVSHVFSYGDTVILVGDEKSNFSHISIYNGSWHSLGRVRGEIATFANLTIDNTELLVFNGAQSSAVVWDYTNSQWFNTTSTLHVNASQAFVEDNATVAFGSLAMMDQSVENAVTVKNSSSNNILPIGLTFNEKHDNVLSSGFYVNDSYIVIGGHFETFDSAYNLVLLDTSTNRTSSIGGVSWNNDADVTDMLSFNDVLYLGLSGKVTVGSTKTKGLIAYELKNDTFSSNQPASLNGDVTSIAAVESDAKLLVGGSFSGPDGTSCTGVCLLDTEKNKWSSASNQTTTGDITFIQAYSSSKYLLSGRNFGIDGTKSDFVSYDYGSKRFAKEDGLSKNKIPGVVEKFIMVDNKTTGRIVSIGTDFIAYYDGSNWNRLDDDLSNSTFSDIVLLDLKKDNDANDEKIFDKDQILLVTGLITVEDVGSFTAAYYNGSSWIPSVITTNNLSVSNTTIRSVLLNKSTASFYGSASKPKQTHHQSASKNFMLTRNVVGVGFGLALGTTLLLGIAAAGVIFASKKRNKYNSGQLLHSRVGEEKMIHIVPPNEVIDNFHVAKQTAS